MEGKTTNIAWRHSGLLINIEVIISPDFLRLAPTDVVLNFDLLTTHIKNRDIHRATSYGLCGQQRVTQNSQSRRQLKASRRIYAMENTYQGGRYAQSGSNFLHGSQDYRNVT